MRKAIIFIFVFLLVFLFSGCNEAMFHGSGYRHSDSDYFENESKLDYYEQIFSGEIVIYTLSRDDFLPFLVSPSYELLREESYYINTFSVAETNQETLSVHLFTIKQDFLNFFGNHEEIQKYIDEKGFKGQIECMAVIEVSKFPMMLWLKTTSETVYITVNDSVEDLETREDTYIYRCYSEAEFCEKFGPKNAKLIVNGKEVNCIDTPIIYCDEASIPILETLNALGAEITPLKSKTEIRLNGETFYLNIEEQKLYRKGFSKENLLYRIIGPVLISPKDDDLMVDCDVFVNTLNLMGKPISTSLDWQNRTISIKYRDA